ncbi:MAG: hypothetical protein KAT58_01685 [candidate division Zixibacteria bacterium]|nr:hypothetical protein [candidate division Zixibacteria bacterium]
MKQDVTNRKIAGVIALLILGSLTLSGCSFQSPEAPSWDTTFQVPLINKRFSSGELFDKLAADNIATDSAGNSFFFIEETLDSVAIDNTLQLDAVNASYTKEIGDIRVVTPAPQAQQIALVDYVPLAAGVVPDTGIQVDKAFDQPSSFSQAVIADGSLIYSAINNTVLPLDSISCEVRQNGGTELVATCSFPGGLAVDAAYTDTVSLDGKAITSDLMLQIYFHTPGGSSQSLAGSVIDFTFTYSDEFHVSSATAQTEEFASSYEERTALNTDYHILGATFSTGTFTFTAENNLALPADLTITFPEITYDGSALSVPFTLGAGGVADYYIDLAGWQVAPIADSILAQISALIPSSGAEFVNINSSDNFSFQFELSQLNFATATAVVAPTEIEWTESTIDIEVPEGFASASLAAVELELTIHNGSELPGELSIQLEGDNGKSFTLTGNIAAGSPSSPSQTIICADDLADLLSPIPGSITVSGTATVGDGVSTVTITNNDFFLASAVITAPLTLTLDAEMVEGEMQKVEVDEDISERVDRLHEAIFNATISNHLPLGASIVVYIATDSTTLYTDPQVTIGPLTFAAATVNDNGIVIGEIVSNNTIHLTSEEFAVFRNPTIYVGPLLDIPGTDSQTVTIRSQDYLDIVACVEISVRVGGEDF